MRTVVAMLSLAVTASAAQAQAFNALWAASPVDIWGVGTSGLVMRGLNNSWTRLFSGATSDLRDIWGASATDIWMVGDGGTILRFDGRGITRMQPPAQHDFVAVNGCGANDVWVLGTSEDGTRPQPLFRWNGTAWTAQPLPVPFLATKIALTCTGVSGAGGAGSAVIAGSSFFDPRPEQRRYVGVVARLQGGRWVSAGWDGRAITDSVLGGTPWVGAFSNGPATLLVGGENNSVLLLSARGGAWTRLPAPPAEFERALVTGDGSPVLVMRDGFARLVAGQWRMTGGSRQTSQGNQAEMDRIRRRMEQIGEAAQRGQATQQMIMELQTLQQQYIQAATGQTGTTEQIMQNQLAQARAAQTLQFGGSLAVWAPRTGSDFYVANDFGSVFRVTGTTSAMLYSPACAQQPELCSR